MISPHTNRCTTVLIVAFLCSLAGAAEPNEPPIHLEFEISPTSLAPLSAFTPLVGRGTDSAWVSWCSAQAGMCRGYRHRRADPLSAFSGTPNVGRILERVRHATRGPVRRAEGAAAHCPGLVQACRALRDHIDPNHPEHLWLFAVTAEDARKMVQAYYQFAHAQFRQEAEARDKAIREISANIVQEEKRILELDALVEATQKALTYLGKSAPTTPSARPRMPSGNWIGCSTRRRSSSPGSKRGSRPSRPTGPSLAIRPRRRRPSWI